MHAQHGQENRRKSLIAKGVLFQACIAALVSVLLCLEKWPIPALAASIFAFGLATVWIDTSYQDASLSGGKPPRWLAKLERLRQYLANEGDDSRASAPTQR